MFNSFVGIEMDRIPQEWAHGIARRPSASRFAPLCCRPNRGVAALQTLWHTERVFVCSSRNSSLRGCLPSISIFTKLLDKRVGRVKKSRGPFAASGRRFSSLFTNTINSYGSQEASALVAAAGTETPVRPLAPWPRSPVPCRKSSGKVRKCKVIYNYIYIYIIYIYSL